MDLIQCLLLIAWFQVDAVILWCEGSVGIGKKSKLPEHHESARHEKSGSTES
jgi:hypothetical protein